jgi:peptide/nickel transport system substrate-binding protein
MLSRISHLRRASLVAVTLAVASFGLAACGSSGSKPVAHATGGTTPVPSVYPTSHTLNLSFLEDPGQPPDPDVYYAGEGLLLTRNMYEGLVQYQPGTADRTVIPSLATSWTISPDGLTYTFQLRQGVKFHDGTPFTSAAVKPSFARRAAVDGGPAYMVSGIKSVVTPGPYTVVITLSQPSTSFLDYLASAYGPVMESPTALAAHAGSDHDQTYLQTHDIGTGPYTLTEAKVGVSYQLQAFPGYWGSQPYYTTVNLPVIDSLSTEEIEFNNGQLAGILHDLTTTAAVQYQKSSKFSFYELPVFENEMVYVNENKGAFTSQAFRQAFLEAINIPAIVAGVFPGGRATVPDQISPAHLLDPQYAHQTIRYDPSALSKLVSALPSSERSIVLGYDTGAPDDQLIAEQIGAQLQSSGLSAKVVGEETSSIYGAVGSVKTAQGAAAPNALIDYFWPDADNPYTWTHINYDPSGGLEYEACNVPGMQSLDNQAVKTGDLSIYNQIRDLVQQSGCWLNVADKTDTMVFQPWLQGVAAAHVVAAPESLLLAKLYPK